MKNYCFLLIPLSCVFFSIGHPLYAQSEGAVHGVVMAKADGSILPDATVRLESTALPTSLQTTVGSDGQFVFQRLVPGQYTLVASHSDFQEDTIRFTLRPREIQSITFELSLRGVVQSVEVTANAAPPAGTYSPSSTVLQKETVESLPLDQRTNLTDMIAMTTPGMIRSHDDFVHVRGNEIALNTFINGVSFWENPHSVFSAGLTPDIIQSANVLTGGFPAEYGNRFGGVIDIVTKSGFSMNNQGALTVGVGTALRHNASIEYGGHTDKVGYYLYSSGFESARFLSPNDPRSIHDTGRGTHSFFQMDFNLNRENFLKLVLMGDGTNFQIPKTSLDDQIRPNARASERTREQSSILTWGRTISNKTLLTTSFYQRWSRAELLPANDPLASSAGNERKVFTEGLKSDLTHFLGRHTLKGGVDLVLLRPDENLFFNGEGYITFSHLLGLPHVHLRGPNRGPITIAEKRTGGQASAYVQDAMQVTRKLRVDAGLRYDGYNLATSDFHFSPRVNFSYRL